MIIAGAGGHALEVLDVLIRNGILKEKILFYDDVNSDRLTVHDYFKVLKDSTQLKEALKNDPKFCIGVGNPIARKKLFGLFFEFAGKLISVRGKNIISEFSEIEQGVDLLDQVYIGPNTSIGFGSLINTKASVHHDVRIGEYCEICPGATLLGRVYIGHYCKVGSSSTILPNVSIGSNVIIGAGALVNGDLPDNVVAIGVPARIVKKIDVNNH